MARIVLSTRFRGYLLAVFLVALATVLRWAGGFYGVTPPFITYYPAAILVVFLADTGAAFLAVALSGLAAWFLFLKPPFSFRIDATGDAISLSLFFAAGVFLTLIARRLTVARAEQATQEEAEAVRAIEIRLSLARQIGHGGAFDWDIRTGDNTWSPELEAMYGLERGAFGKTQSSWEQLVYPEDRAAAIALVEETLRTGNPVEGEWRVQWPDKSIHWILGRFQGIIDEDGKPVRLTGVNIDITDRKRAEEALKASREELRQRAEEVETLMEVAPVAIWRSYDPHCNEIVGNRAANTFYEAYEKENVSANITAARRFFRNGKELAAEELPMQAAAATNTDILNEELDVLLPSGREMHMIGSARPLRGEGGEVRGCVGAFLDVTERRRAEAVLKEHAHKLEETNRELESFVYTISHDLRTPLRAMNGYSVMLQEKLSSTLDDEATRRLKAIETNAIRMGQLVDDLLAFSRAGRTALDLSLIDMNRLVGEVLESLKTDEKEHLGVSVGPLPPAHGDPVLVGQVVTNLLSNAVKFSRKHREPFIEVGGSCQDGNSVYFVKDNGVGFDMRFYGQLFGVFNRLVTDEEFEGTGVGLAIVHRLVTRHGGRVWAEGKPGEGATFYFSLPVKG